MDDSQQGSQTYNATRTVLMAAASILAVGLLIAGGIYWSLRRGDGTGSGCGGTRPIGSTAGLLDDAKLSPYNGTLGGRCEYWIAYRNGHLVAVKPHIVDKTCSLMWDSSRNSFTCAHDTVPWSEVQFWPSQEITSGPNNGVFEIDFGT